MYICMTLPTPLLLPLCWKGSRQPLIKQCSEWLMLEGWNGMCLILTVTTCELLQNLRLALLLGAGS